jgi:hypothetical protein
MEYKICDPLKTRHVVPFEKYIEDNKVLSLSPLVSAATAVRQAVEHGWFDGDKPDVDDMLPADVLALSTKIWNAYFGALGFDAKNLLARQRTSPKA